MSSCRLRLNTLSSMHSSNLTLQQWWPGVGLGTAKSPLCLPALRLFSSSRGSSAQGLYLLHPLPTWICPVTPDWTRPTPSLISPLCTTYLDQNHTAPAHLAMTTPYIPGDSLHHSWHAPALLGQKSLGSEVIHVGGGGLGVVHSGIQKDCKLLLLAS